MMRSPADRKRCDKFSGINRFILPSTRSCGTYFISVSKISVFRHLAAKTFPRPRRSRRNTTQVHAVRTAVVCYSRWEGQNIIPWTEPTSPTFHIVSHHDTSRQALLRAHYFMCKQSTQAVQYAFPEKSVLRIRYAK
jgi:hypothetical protein